MKKFFSIYLSAAVLMLVACSGNSTHTDQQTDTTVTVPKTGPDSAANNSIVPPSAAPGNATNSSLADTTYHGKDSAKSHKLKH